ncbi:putative disease resistance protein RGA1 [Carex rostrata]
MAMVAEASAGAIIGKLVDTVLTYTDGSWWLGAKAMKAEAQKLQAALPQIKAVLRAAERGKINPRDRDLEAWMWQFRDAVEEADDALDEIEYYQLEEKIRAKGNRVSGAVSGCKRKLVDFFRNAFINDGILKKLTEAVRVLETVATGVGPFLELVRGLNQEVVGYNFRKTGPLLNDMVIGRENEKEIVLEWLTVAYDGDDQALLSAFLIYGAGGIGKTALAQLVCSDQKVKENFEQIVWVCLSDNDTGIDAATVIKIIIEDFSKKKCEFSNLGTLQTTLQEIVASKKFLLVLDDIWRDETSSEWEKILAPLKYSQKGSKILLTTRMESVTNMIAGLIEGKKKKLRLEGLEEKIFVELLFRYAFSGTNPDEYQHLHEIGNQIAKKLWACPLAAKVIGGVLNSNINFDYWKKILEENISDAQTNMDGITKILQLSYYHLPPHLQSCFRYCGIFPQDMELEEGYLVNKWMGSGLIPRHEHGKRPEDVAHDYLEQLTAKSFFSKVSLPPGVRDYHVYRIHDLLHDLAQSISGGECLRITDDATYIPPTTRHLSIKVENVGIFRKIHNLNRLRTFEITCIEQDLDDDLGLNEILTGMTSLRLLSVNTKAIKNLPSRIGDLIHLRYLSFQGLRRGSKSNFCNLPKSINKLYHLILFKLSDSIEIKGSKLEGMCNLINLRYLYLHCSGKTSIPQVGNLHSLQELNHYYVNKKEGYNIAELKHLTQLHKLYIHNLQYINNPNDASEANLNQKRHLKSLGLCWANGERDKDEQVAENLKPPVNLDELDIYYYSGIRSPNWLIDQSFCNLTSITLRYCYRLEHLPPLGQIKSLKYLSLDGLKAVKQIGNSLYSSNSTSTVFPSLRNLGIRDMPECEEWTGVDGKLLFPNLEMLLIANCPKLRAMPSLPPNLKRFKVSGVALHTLPGFYPLPSVNNKGAFPIPFALEGLTIRNCRRLFYIPVELLEESNYLSSLHVSDCPNLIAKASSLGLPKGLKHLCFGNIGHLEPLFMKSLQDLTSLVELTMNGCASIRLLPPDKVFSKLTKLRELRLLHCKGLASLGGIEELASLRKLSIRKCDKLIEVSFLQQPLITEINNQANLATHHLKLENLHVLQMDHSSLLLLDPLRNLRLVRNLRIYNGFQITSLPEQWLLQNRFSLQHLTLHGVSSLQSLPQSVGSMYCLQDLSISGAILINSLPNLPASLKSLTITGCQHELKNMCQRDNGFYRPKISQIPEVIIESVDEKENQ